MLAAHSKISCGPETHFFRKLARIDPGPLLRQESWPQAAVDFVCSIDHTSFSERQPVPLIEKYCLDGDQIFAYLQGKPPSIPNMLAAVTEQYMAAMGKARWAEKTPDHILNLDRIREHFPHSPVIRIIRDPRDVAISLTKVPWGAMSYLEALLLWKRLDQASQAFFQEDGCCYSLRYEDLITSPDEELSRLCQFIGEEYEAGMLDTSETGKQLNARHVPWKDKASQPVDASNMAKWKAQLAEPDIQLAEALLGDRLDALGYPRQAQFTRLGQVRPSLALVPKYAEGFKSLAASGIRFWKASQDEPSSAKIYLGDPVGDGWLPGNRLQHILGALAIVLEIRKATRSGQPVYWLASSEAQDWSGYSAAVLKKLLLPYRFPGAES